MHTLTCLTIENSLKQHHYDASAMVVGPIFWFWCKDLPRSQSWPAWRVNTIYLKQMLARQPVMSQHETVTRDDFITPISVYANLMKTRKLRISIWGVSQSKMATVRWYLAAFTTSVPTVSAKHIHTVLLIFIESLMFCYVFSLHNYLFYNPSNLSHINGGTINYYYYLVYLRFGLGPHMLGIFWKETLSCEINVCSIDKSLNIADFNHTVITTWWFFKKLRSTIYVCISTILLTSKPLHLKTKQHFQLQSVIFVWN